MKSKDKIFRSLGSFEAEGRKIRGLAAATGTWSKDLGGYVEMILPDAINEELIKRSDVMLCVDHDPSKVVARSKFGVGSLLLTVTGRGLEFETEVPDTQLGHDLLVMIQRGDYSQCSFCFTIEKQEWKNENGQSYRTITAIDRLYDVSVVYDPAYDATSVDVRSMAAVDNVKKMQSLEKEILDIYVGK